jgi:hypothetical protein
MTLLYDISCERPEVVEGRRPMPHELGEAAARGKRPERVAVFCSTARRDDMDPPKLVVANARMVPGPAVLRPDRCGTKGRYWEPRESFWAKWRFW